MRIIAGQRRGMVLHEFDFDFIRPTKDIVKEFIFNVLANVLDISQVRVADLFAGTGAIGLEALSRGASSAVFVDNHPKAIELIRRNLQKSGFESSADVVQMDVSQWLTVPPDRPLDLIFADAPYACQLGDFLVEKIGGWGYLEEKGFLVIECSPKQDLVISSRSWRSHKQKKWGESQVHVLQYMGA